MPPIPTLQATFPVQVTQPARLALEPYLLHDAELGGLITPDPARRRLLLHPRVGSVEALDQGVAASCAALGVTFSVGAIGPLTEAQRVRVFTVVFFSKSKLSAPLAPGLPRSWRRALSNFYPSDLDIEGAPYASVEHYFQASKAACSDRPEMALRFRADAEGPDATGPDPAAAKKAGGRGGYRRFGATLDVQRWLTRRDAVMQTALQARVAQDALFRGVLRSTKGLELLHFERAGASSYWGGSLRRADGLPQGENRLGKMLTALRDG